MLLGFGAVAALSLSGVYLLGSAGWEGGCRPPKLRWLAAGCFALGIVLTLTADVLLNRPRWYARLGAAVLALLCCALVGVAVRWGSALVIGAIVASPVVAPVVAFARVPHRFDTPLAWSVVAAIGAVGVVSLLIGAGTACR